MTTSTDGFCEGVLQESGLPKSSQSLYDTASGLGTSGLHLFADDVVLLPSAALERCEV